MLAITTGLFIVLFVLFDIFQTIVVPRWKPKRLRIMQSAIDHLLWPVWKANAKRKSGLKEREDVLSKFAPVSLTTLFVSRLILLVWGFALILWGLRDDMKPPLSSFDNALYVAGTSICNMGLGDYLPVSNISRAVVIFTGFSGLLVFALVISLLFALHSFVNRREVLINLLVARTDGSTSGLSFLINHAKYSLKGELTNHFGAWEAWAAELLESHSTYPVLGYFRSSIRGMSWIGSIGSVLDAASLLVSAVEDTPAGAARLFWSVGCRTARELVHIYDLEPLEGKEIDKAEFERALAELASVGYKLRDGEHSWAVFQELRTGYTKYLQALGTHFAIPATAWIYE